jgi:RNA polymerase sigma-70 factor (ECF subfamily)
MELQSDLAVLGGLLRRDVAMSRTDPFDAAAAVALDHADDETLVRAFQAGRLEAFDRIVERHRRAVYQLCFRFVGNHEDAADLSQDVFVRAFKGLGRFKGESSMRTWLYRVSVNVSLNRVATRRVATEPLDAADPVDARAEHPLDALVRGEQRARVRQAVSQLPPKQRATLVLRVYQDLDYGEIAAILGGSVGGVKANFFHALANLKRLVQS